MLARLATPEPADIFAQLIVLQDLQQSLYQCSVIYVKRIAASYFKRCHKHVVSNINSTAFNGGYDAIRIVIREKYFLLKLLNTCTESVKNFVKLDDVFGHLFDQAMKWRLLKIEGNDAVLTESRTQKNNFYADILRDATDNVYGTTKNAVTSFEKRLKKKNACEAIISGVPCHDQRSATIVSTQSSHSQHSGKTLGSANLSAATAAIPEGPKERSNTEKLSKRMLNSYEKQKPCFTEGNTKLPATATTVAPTENNGVKEGGKEDAVFEGRKGKDDGPPALKSTTSSLTPVTKDEGRKKEDDGKVSDPLYSAEERKQIDDYIHEVMTEERSKNQHRREHDYSQGYSMKRVCTTMEENKKGCWGTVIHGYYMNDNDCWWTILFDDNKKLYWNGEQVYQARCLYDRTTNTIQDPYGNHKASLQSVTSVDGNNDGEEGAVVNVETEDGIADTSTTVTASKRTTSRRLFDDQSTTTTTVSPKIPQTKRTNRFSKSIVDAYSVVEQQCIDDSINATIKLVTENRSEDMEHVYSMDYYYKRVLKNVQMNNRACWGMVVLCYYDDHQNCRWTVHFDDNTQLIWNSQELCEKQKLYETRKTKDPSKRPLELRALHPSHEDLLIFEYEKKEKETDDDFLMRNCKSVLYDPSLYTVAEWKSISRNIGTTDYSKWIAVDDYWWTRRGVCPRLVLRAVGGEVMTKALTHKQKGDVRFELIRKNDDNEGHKGQPAFFDMFIKKDTDESKRFCRIYYDFGGDARLVDNGHQDSMVVGIPKLYFGVAEEFKGKKKPYEVTFIDDEERSSYTKAQYNEGRLLYEKTKQICERRHGGGPDVPIGSFLRYEIENSLDQRVKIRKVTNSEIGRELIGGDKNTTLYAYHFGTIVNVELDEKDRNEAKVTIMYDIEGEKDDIIPWRFAHFYICDYNDHHHKNIPRSNCVLNPKTGTKAYHLEVAGTEPLKEKKNDPRLCHETMFCNHGGGGGAVGSKMIHCKDMKGFEEHVDNANCYLSFDGHCILKDDGSFPAKHHLKASSGNRQKLLEEINKQRDDMNDAEPNRHRSSIDRSFLALRRPMLENGTVAYYCSCDTCVDTGEPVCICYRCYNQQLLAAKEKERMGVTDERLEAMLHSGTNGYGDNRSRGGLRSDASTARQKKNLGKRKERS